MRVDNKLCDFQMRKSNQHVVDKTHALYTGVLSLIPSLLDVTLIKQSLLSCQPRVTVMSCFVYNIIREA